MILQRRYFSLGKKSTALTIQTRERHRLWKRQKHLSWSADLLSAEYPSPPADPLVREFDQRLVPRLSLDSLIGRFVRCLAISVLYNYPTHKVGENRAASRSDLRPFRTRVVD